jgi:DNA-nicking Smr family endonuclease
MARAACIFFWSMAKSPETTTAKRRSRAGRLTREDLALWRRLASTVAPLPGRLLPPLDEVPPSEPLPAPPAPATPRRRVRTPPPPAPPAPPPPAPDLPEIAHGDVAGVDKRTAQRMRRGQLVIEARIDLHGLTEDDAHRALSSFVIGAQRAGRRCVLVVTGKGLRQDGRSGVLRRNVPRWLNEAPNRARILAFCHAQPRDGGEGALYLLLRRRKLGGIGG